jgi:predicted DCC family thiol-disulfide oxidoreductase YuxK
MSVVLFDGNCGLCNRSVQFILRFEKSRELKFASLDSDFAKNIFLQFGFQKGYNQSILFYQNGKLYKRSNAVLRIIPFLNWYFFPFLTFWLIPKFIRDLFYELIARNRSRFSIVCELIVPENSVRFLD